jgi:hypothetical protein
LCYKHTGKKELTVGDTAAAIITSEESSFVHCEQGAEVFVAAHHSSLSLALVLHASGCCQHSMPTCEWLELSLNYIQLDMSIAGTFHTL